MGWQWISALWLQNWTDLSLDQGLGAREYEKHGESFASFLGALTFTL
jgi:hypothetical protein